MSDRERLYFGHPINVYGTPLQQALLLVIQEAYPWCEIVNPDSPEHSASYQEYAKTRVDGEGKPTGMGYFFEVILPTCQRGVFLPFRDGMFGAGVYGEAEWLHQRHRPIAMITHDGDIVAPLRLDPALKLDRDSTRARIRLPDGKIIRPY